MEVLKILKTFLLRPRLYCLSSRRLETKTLDSRTTSLPPSFVEGWRQWWILACDVRT